MQVVHILDITKVEDGYYLMHSEFNSIEEAVEDARAHKLKYGEGYHYQLSAVIKEGIYQ